MRTYRIGYTLDCGGGDIASLVAHYRAKNKSDALALWRDDFGGIPGYAVASAVESTHPVHGDHRPWFARNRDAESNA